MVQTISQQLLYKKVQKINLSDLLQPLLIRTAVFYWYKTTNRTMYQQLQQKDVFDVLLWNEEGAITEFTIGNIVVEIDGTLFTPPVSCGLLPGTFRKHLLEENVIQEKELFKQDIITANNIWLINSVREWVKVTVI